MLRVSPSSNESFTNKFPLIEESHIRHEIKRQGFQIPAIIDGSIIESPDRVAMPNIKTRDVGKKGLSIKKNIATASGSRKSLSQNTREQKDITKFGLQLGFRRLLSVMSSSINKPKLSDAGFIVKMLPNVMCCILDLKGVIKHTSERFSEKTSIELGSDFIDLLDQVDRRRFKQDLEKTIDTSASSIGDYFIHLTNGESKTRIVFSWTLSSSSGLDYVVATGEPTQLAANIVIEKKHPLMTPSSVQPTLPPVYADDGILLRRTLINPLARPPSISEDDIRSKVQYTPERRIDSSLKQKLKEIRSKLAMVEEQLETKKTFVRYISHEVRTPLSVLLAGLDLLFDIDSEEERQKLRRTLLDACGTAIDILNDFLTYEKLDANILVVEKTECDLLLLLGGVVALFSVQAERAGITLELSDISEWTAILLNADPFKISQVLRNLVSNAVKFTPRGGRVNLSLTVIDNMARLLVQDSGAGMSKEDRRRLFKEIVQFNPGKLQNGQGSGLGLYLTQQIVSLHGGRIGVDLEYDGVGSVFYLEIPIIKTITSSSAVVETVAQRRLSVRSLRAVGKTSFRMLIVDDAEICRKFHSKYLSPHLAEILTASDGKEAVDLVLESMEKNEPIDGIIMDSSMPVLNGLNATKIIRSMGYSGKIFGVTGNAFQSDIDEFLHHGASLVFAKPVSSEQYSKMILALAGEEIIKF